MRLRIGHSPDPDDAFMFFGFASGQVEVPGCTIEHVLCDIQALNERARTPTTPLLGSSGRTMTRALEIVSAPGGADVAGRKTTRPLTVMPGWRFSPRPLTFRPSIASSRSAQSESVAPRP